jgi:MFS family permease
MILEARVKDRRRIYTAAFLRALATGLCGVLLGLHLAARGFSLAETGRVVSAGLLGAALAALLATLFGDRWGRRRMLVALSVVGALGLMAVALLPGPFVLAAAFLGMVNGMGRDRGAGLILDQAILPATADPHHRTRSFAWYNVSQDAGHALGGLLAAVTAPLRHGFGLSEAGALEWLLAASGVCLLLSVLPYATISRAVEPAALPSFRSIPLSARGRKFLIRISDLFALDSIAGGFLTTALVAVFFSQRFGTSGAVLGVLFFAARAANAGSHLVASWLARRIGLVNTMVFTHIPSSILLATVAFAPNFPVAAAVFLLREGLVEMDVPTRQSYVMGVMEPGERMWASGVTHLVRLGGWAVAPAFAGALMGSSWIAAPLLVGAALKIVYDVLLYVAFRAHRPPEERDVPVSEAAPFRRP